jgi:uncharacterized protein (TIGR02996 family)
MAIEANFLRTIQEHPDDEGLRAAYADWLETEGRTLEAEYLRLEARLRADLDPEVSGPLVKRHAQLFARLSRAWLAQVDRSRIVMCVGRLADPDLDRAQCPGQWIKLQPTHKPCIRFCNTCNQEVPFEATQTGEPPAQKRQDWYWSHQLRPIGGRNPPQPPQSLRTNFLHRLRNFFGDFGGPRP